MQTCMCQSASVEAKNNSCELVLTFRLNEAGSLGFTRLHAPSWLRRIHQILVFTSYYRNAGIADTYHTSSKFLMWVLRIKPGSPGLRDKYS